MLSNNIWWWADVNKRLDKAEEKSLWICKYKMWKME